MTLRHCDICGGLVGAAADGSSASPGAGGEPGGGGSEDVGVLCEVCLATRRVLPDPLAGAGTGAGGGAGEANARANRFRCPHCGSRLRSKVVPVRIEIACPKCAGSLVLLPGGAIEAGPPEAPAAGATPAAPTTGSSGSSSDASEVAAVAAPPAQTPSL